MKNENVRKVLLVGQSLGNDTVWLLYSVLRAEMPEQEFIVGNIYASVYLSKHRQNIEANEPAYYYYKFSNDELVTTEGFTIDAALKDEKWDLIIFNEGTYPSTQEKEFLDGDHGFMIDHIRKVAEPGFLLAYNTTGANPTNALLWGEDRRRPPANVQERFMREFGGSRNKYYDALCANFVKYIETNKEYDLVFHTGTALQYASETYGVPEADPQREYDLHRDYVHLSDFGRLLVAYQLYAQLYGLEKLENVNVQVIKEAFRHKESKRFGDLQITQKHKDAIIASVNWALANPHKVPPQTARPEAFLERPDLEHLRA